MCYYSNSPFFPALHLFPEIGLDVTKFASVPSKKTLRNIELIIYLEFHWSDNYNRRQFFEQVAQKRGFDPLIAENWYKVRNTFMLNLKVQIFLLFSV